MVQMNKFIDYDLFVVFLCSFAVYSCGKAASSTELLLSYFCYIEM